MNRASAFGIVLTVVGLVGYGLGVTMTYPGRAFSLALVMTGVALVAMGSSFDPAGESW